MFINMNLGGITDPKPAAAGRYALQVTEADVKQKPGKAPVIHVSIGFSENPTVPNIRHFISLPRPEDEEKTAYFKKLMLKRFLSQFSIAFNEAEGFNVEDFLGATATAQVNLTSPDEDEQGRVFNRLVLDYLPDESKG